jgi:hypothetical protein
MKLLSRKIVLVRGVARVLGSQIWSRMQVHWSPMCVMWEDETERLLAAKGAKKIRKGREEKRTTEDTEGTEEIGTSSDRMIGDTGMAQEHAEKFGGTPFRAEDDFDNMGSFDSFGCRLTRSRWQCDWMTACRMAVRWDGTVGTTVCLR